MSNRYVLLVVVVLTLNAAGTSDAQEVAADFALTNLLDQPRGVAVDEVNRALYVADTVSSRILRYDSIDTISATTSPTAVLGQLDFSGHFGNQGQPTPSQGSLSDPLGLWVDSASTLWVADTGNSRVVWWANAHALANGSLATGYVGQSSWTAVNLTTDPDFLYAPAGVVTGADGALWVADGANRVIVKYSPPIVSGKFPDGFIGAPYVDFTGPTHLRFDAAGNLYASDTLGDRVVFIPQTETLKSMGAVASFVYGQLDVYSKTPELTSATSLNYTGGLAIADGMVVVCSSNDNRVMVFPPGPPVSNDIAAIRVLGQPDFTSHGSGSTLSRMSLPYDVAYDSVANTLWVVDTFNSRVLSFSNSIVRVLQNLTSLDVAITFQGQQPTVFVYPKDPASGSIYPGQKQLLQPQVVEELDSNKTVISTTTLPLLNYTVSTTVDAWDNQHFTFSSVLHGGGAQLSIRYSLFAVGQTLNSSGISFNTKPSDLKFEMALSGWPFAHPSNTLRLYLMLNVIPNVTSFQQNNSTNDITTFTLLSSNETMATTIRMIGYGTTDGIDVPISFSLAQNQPDPGLLALVLEIPHFNSSFQYDPDFSVLLPSQQQEDSSATDLLPLLSLITLLVFPTALVVVVIIIAFLVWLRRRRILWATRKGMTGNFILPRVDRGEESNAL